MRTEIFAAEVNLKKTKHAHKACFNDTQTRAYLGGLSACYDEVLIITNTNHLFVLATGQSPMLITHALNELASGASEVFISQEAIAALIKIAKGERWSDVNVRDIRKIILNACNLSIESDCFGETLQRITEAALMANMLTSKRYEENYIDQVISHPAMSSFDHSKTLLN